MIELSSKYLGDGEFIVQKDINEVLAVTLEKYEKGGYVALLYQNGEDVIGEYSYYTLEEAAKAWGKDNWYI